MKTEIKARIERVLLPNSVFRIDVDIIDAVNIDASLLVFAQKDDTFQHVATLYDLETWDSQPTLACSYYRGRGAKVFFNRLIDATKFERITRERLAILANSHHAVLHDYPAVEIVLFTSGT